MKGLPLSRCTIYAVNLSASEKTRLTKPLIDSASRLARCQIRSKRFKCSRVNNLNKWSFSSTVKLDAA